MSNRTQQGEYQMMVQADFSRHTTDVNSYHHYIKVRSTRTKDIILEDNESRLYIICTFSFTGKTILN